MYLSYRYNSYSIEIKIASKEMEAVWFNYNLEVIEFGGGSDPATSILVSSQVSSFSHSMVCPRGGICGLNKGYGSKVWRF